MENYTRHLVETILTREEAVWLYSRLAKICCYGSMDMIIDIVRNEENVLEIRMKPLVFEEETDD